MFAAVTSDARLQLWDLSVSAIDPVVSLDTNLDYVESPAGLLEKTRAEAIESAVYAALNAAATTPGGPRKTPGAATSLRRNGGTLKADEEKDGGAVEASPVVKLLKNLSSGAGPRILTSVLFGLKSPVVAVGDNRGTVIVYRILDPVTVSHDHASALTLKLQQCLARQDQNLIAIDTDENKSIGSASATEEHDQIDGGE